MPSTADLSSEHQARLVRLKREFGTESADCGGCDESAYFALVDEAAQDPEGNAELLAEMGRAFTNTFIAPYLHAEDLPLVLAEISGLLAIHHRARLIVERVDRDTAMVRLIRLVDGQSVPSTSFEAAVIEHAMRMRFPRAQTTATEDADGELFEIALRG